VVQNSLESLRIERTTQRLSFYFSGQVVIKLLYFPGIVLATRAAGPAGWGLVTAAISAGFILITGVNLGLNPYVTREVAAGTVSVTRLTAAATRFRLFASGLFLLAMPGFLLLTIRGIEVVVLLGVVTYLLADSWAKYLFALLRGAENTRFEIVGANVEKVVFALFALLAMLASSHSDPVGVVAVGFGVGALCKLGIAAYSSRRVFHTAVLPLRYVLATFTRVRLWLRDFRYLRESAAFLFMAMFSTLYFRVDTYMLAVLRGNEEAGFYGAAYRLIEGLLFAPEAVLVVFSPLLVRALKSVGAGQYTDEQRSKVVRQVAALQVAVAGPVGLALMLERNWITNVLYGSAFTPAAQLLFWLAPAFVFMAVNFLLGGLLTATYMQRSLLVISGVAAVANVLLNLLLIPRYGAIGAVAATVFTEGALGVGMLTRVAGRVPVDWIALPVSIAVLYLAAIVMAPNIILHGYLPFGGRLLIGLVSTGAFLLVLLRRGIIPNPLAHRIEG
jgi:O-antigen/teichoic acid export membrane protein